MPYDQTVSYPLSDKRRPRVYLSATSSDMIEEPDAIIREAQRHEAFAELRQRMYIGRPDYFEALDRHASGIGSPLLVFGESGSGKTALLANWVARWREDHPKDFIVQHYVGSTADSACHWRLMARVMGEIKRWSGSLDAVPVNRDDMLNSFPLWLTKAKVRAEHEGMQFILVIDALDRFDDRENARLLGWLPEHPFTGPLRLIVSTQADKPEPNSLPKAIQRRGWHKLRIQPLTLEERRQMIAYYLTRFGKAFDERLWERLASAPPAADPLYIRILLDDLLGSDTNDRLEKRLSDYLTADDVPALLQKVLARYQRDYERNSKNLVAESLSLIYAARRGLSETELFQLLRPADQEQLPPDLWLPLRTVLANTLENRGGILNFANDTLRRAVEIAFAKDTDHRAALHLRLADYFENQPITARTCDELPWLFWQAKERDRLRSCLLNMDCFLEIYERDREELMRYWVFLKEKRSMGKAYLDAFNVWSHDSNRDVINIVYAADDLACFLHSAAFHAEVELLYRRTLTIWEGSQGAEHPAVASVLDNLATLLKNANRLAEAVPLMCRALAIDEKNLGPKHPAIAKSLNRLALLLKETNRLAEAEFLMCRALAIDETNFGLEHPNVATDLNNLAMLLKESNRFAEAESLMCRVLAIDKLNLGPTHPSVALDLNNLAQLLKETSRLAEAESLMCRALAINETSLGPDHPDVATGLNNLAMLLRETNRLDEAVSLMRRAVAILETYYYTTGHEYPCCQNYKDTLCAMQTPHPARVGCLQLIFLALAAWAFIVWCLH